MNEPAVVKGTTTSQNINVAVAGSKLVVVINISAGTGSLVVTINGVSASGYKYPLLISDSLSGVSTTPLRIFPGSTPSENAVANDLVPGTIEISVVVTGTITYGVDVIAGD